MDLLGALSVHHASNRVHDGIDPVVFQDASRRDNGLADLHAVQRLDWEDLDPTEPHTASRHARSRKTAVLPEVSGMLGKWKLHWGQGSASAFCSRSSSYVRSVMCAQHGQTRISRVVLSSKLAMMSSMMAPVRTAHSFACLWYVFMCQSLSVSKLVQKL